MPARCHSYLQQFETYMQSERQLSAHTVRNYLYELQRGRELLPEGIDLLNVGREHWQQVLAK
ncbi:MAG: site-specific integrase, partial [Shewanella sp.]